MSDQELSKSKRAEARPLPVDAPIIPIGDWYWVRDDDKKEHFACVTHVGSNFVKLENPFGKNWRVHFDDFTKECRREADPEKVLREKIARCNAEVQAKLTEIRKITARLGLDPKAENHDSKALAVLSSERDPKAYKKSLVKAKDKELPKLFKELKESHEALATWMSAPAIPLEAMAGAMEGVVEKIDDRVFSISLYAGLSEDVKEILGGTPAPASEKLRLFQNLLFMDEECLLNYRKGGMEFSNIAQFDEWLAQPENFQRILPFPRCAVAFQVRRERKGRDSYGCVLTAFVNMKLEELDKLTFFYIRNGEKLFRMDCDQKFDETIFPGRQEFDLSEPMMADTTWSKVKIIPKRQYDDARATFDKGHAEYLAWEEEHKKDPEKNKPSNPHWHFDADWHFEYRSYEPFDKSSVYYDEMEKEVANRVKYYNRIALILQGLFDRSEILHPHPPVRLWDPDGFLAAVELIYDGTDVIHHGPTPDFDAYVKACNASLGTGSITVGQEYYFGKVEAEKENEALARRGARYSHETYFPYGNKGPGLLAKISSWSNKKRAATYTWMRERRSYSYWARNDGPINTQIAVPEEHLFNVSAYKPGDFKQFFLDPRTRRAYLKWAPVLLAAEEYHAGNLKLGEDKLEARKKEKAKK